MQLAIRFENNSHSQAILEANIDRFEGQCKTILKLLKEGGRLTVRDMVLMGIGDPRRRIKDLRDNGIEIKDELKEKRFKEYYL